MKPKPKKVNNQKKKLIDLKWVSFITSLAFIISIGFSIVSQTIIPNVQVLISIILVLVVILIGVIFDMIGVAVTVADIRVFHSMAAKKIKGAKMAIKLIYNAPKVSSICNDVIGDICGIVSGSGGAAISTMVAINLRINVIIPSLVVTALIASLTIGGKALGKGIAVARANFILEKFSKFISTFSKRY